MMRRHQSRTAFILLLTPLVLWLGLLIIIPHIDMLLISLRQRVSFGVYEPSLMQYEKALTEPLYLRTFMRTAVMSVLATAITLLIAFPVAYYIAKMAKGRLQQVLFMLCLIPFYVSELVRTFGWMILLRETGIVSKSAAMGGARRSAGGAALYRRHHDGRSHLYVDAVHGGAAGDHAGKSRRQRG